MNTSENEKIQKNTQDNEKLNNYTTEYTKASIAMLNIIASKEKHRFIIPEKFFTDQEIDALTRLNRLADKDLRFIIDVREYTKMVAFVNFFCGISGGNNLVNIDCDIIKPKKLEDEIIDKYGVEVYKDITSTNNKYKLGALSIDGYCTDKLGALSIDGYCTDILDLEYLVRLLNNFDIKCSIDYDNDVFHYNIEHSKENNNQSKK